VRGDGPGRLPRRRDGVHGGRSLMGNSKAERRDAFSASAASSFLMRRAAA
jgi:hypothetical protein